MWSAAAAMPPLFIDGPRRRGRRTPQRSSFLLLLARHLLGVARLPERHIDRMAAIEERKGRARADAERPPHREQRLVLGMELQTGFHRLHPLLAIPRTD